MNRLSSIAESSSPYRNPDLARHLGSCEGLRKPEPVPQKSIPSSASFWQQQGNRAFAWIGAVLPGLVLAMALGLVAESCSRWLGVNILGFAKSPISAVMLAVATGLLVRNTIGLPSVYDAGLQVCVKTILRIGVALLGIRLSLLAVGQIGLTGLPVVIGCIAAALLLVSALGRGIKLSRRLGTLIAVGTSICGVSAIVATGPVIKAEDDEVAYSVACITLFGMLTLFVYPFAAHWLFGGDPQQAGMFLGTAIHDTAQVTGAGLMYQQQFDAPHAMNTAVVVKLVRNLSMIAVIPLMAILYRRNHADKDKAPAWHTMVPLFVLAFIAMAALRTVGDIGTRPFGILSTESWTALTNQTAKLAEWLLMLAMASVGLGTSFAKLKKLGWKPLTVGFAAALGVGVVSIMLTKLLG